MRYSTIVIGAGPAGSNCAMRLSQLGHKVAIIERDYLGGICTNWGCTPSKAMIECAKIARTVKDSSIYGIHCNFEVKFEEIAKRRDNIVKIARERSAELLRLHDVDIFIGEAKIIEKGKVLVKKGKLNLNEQMEYNNQEETLDADNIVIATGSHPLIPGFINKNDPGIVSSNRLITIDHLPETLTILGGGVIGLEFATIFSNLGSKVTIIEMADRVLVGMDSEISEEIRTILEHNGVRILTMHKVLSAENGTVKAENLLTHSIVGVKSDMTLVAIGRNANIDEESYNRLGINHTTKGIDVDDYMQSSVKGIWSVGDATGKSILAHVGIQQGLVCAENIARPESRKMDYGVIPAVIYTIPEIVGVGHVPKDLTGVIVTKVPFTINLRAVIEGNDQGFIKIWTKDNKLIAAEAIGHNVSEIMQEMANMVALGIDLRSVSEIIHAHPTYSEITRTVLEKALGKCTEF